MYRKLVGARFQLYRRRFLQVNIRWKALDEIYKIRKPLHRTELKIFGFPLKSIIVADFFLNFAENQLKSQFRKISKNAANHRNISGILPEYRESPDNCRKSMNFPEFL